MIDDVCITDIPGLLATRLEHGRSVVVVAPGAVIEVPGGGQWLVNEQGRLVCTCSMCGTFTGDPDA